MPKYFGNRAKHYPLVLGHEFCGIVEDGPEELKVSWQLEYHYGIVVNAIIVKW